MLRFDKTTSCVRNVMWCRVLYEVIDTYMNSKVQNYIFFNSVSTNESGKQQSHKDYQMISVLSYNQPTVSFLISNIFVCLL